VGIDIVERFSLEIFVKGRGKKIKKARNTMNYGLLNLVDVIGFEPTTPTMSRW